MTDDETDRLTAGMAAGDAGAVEAFYRHYYPWMLAEAKRATRRDESVGLDVVHDAVLRVVRTVRRVGSERRLRAWLRLVVQAAAYDRLRSDQRRGARETAALAMATRGRDATPVLDACAAAEQIEWLRAQIARMDAGLSRVIEWRFDRGWTLARIARATGVSIATVDGQLRRALRTLAARAAEDLGD